MPDRRIPSDVELRDAIHAVQIAWLQATFIAHRLLWEQTALALDVDAQQSLIRDELVNRPGV